MIQWTWDKDTYRGLTFQTTLRTQGTTYVLTVPPNVIPFKCHLQNSHYCVNDLKYTIIPCKPSAISMDCLTVVGWARVVTLWSGVGPWGRIACLAHNVIGSHPGECDCCAEPPSGTVALLFQPVNTLNAVREPRQTPVAILSGGFVLSSGPSSAPTKHRRTELAF